MHLASGLPTASLKAGFSHSAGDAINAIETSKARSSSNVEFSMQTHATHAALRTDFNVAMMLFRRLAANFVLYPK